MKRTMTLMAAGAIALAPAIAFAAPPPPADLAQPRNRQPGVECDDGRRHVPGQSGMGTRELAHHSERHQRLRLALCRGAAAKLEEHGVRVAI